MSDNIGLIIALAAPILVLTVLRINAVMVFLSLCLGEVLVGYVADDASTTLNLFSSHAPSTVSKSMLQLVLLLGPAVLTSVFMIFSVKGRARVLLNLLPAAGVGFLSVVLAVPHLAPGLRYAIQSEQAWHQLSKAQALVLGLSALVSLVFMWSQRRGHHEGHERHGR